MNYRKIDVTGKPCPIPVIEAKKALTEPGSGGVLVRVDNIIAVQNLEKMVKGQGYGFLCSEEQGGVYNVAISRDTEDDHLPVFHEAPQNAERSEFVVAIGRDTMGEGAEELGRILLKGFIYALSEFPATPGAVVFFNTGARLTSDGANTIGDLKKLEEKGATILTCGTCIDYYSLPAPAAGGVTNMYEIAEIMAKAAKVVNI